MLTLLPETDAPLAFLAYEWGYSLTHPIHSPRKRVDPNLWKLLDRVRMRLQQLQPWLF
jgi:hypothetical protein